MSSNQVSEQNDTTSVAIIGAGVSGLSCAYFLSQYGGKTGEGKPRFELEVLEADSRIGGHTATKNIEHNGQSLAIDTGFIVYNDWTYPNFIRLLDEIGVSNQCTDMSFSVSCDASGLEYSGSSVNTLFAQRLNLFRWQYLQMLYNIVRFNKQAISDLENKKIDSAITLGQYLKINNYTGLFESHYLVPMCAAIWSASTEMVQQFPLLFFVNFFKNHGLLSVNDRPQWRVIKGGSKQYLQPLTANFESKIRCNTIIKSVEREENKVIVRFDSGESKVYDQVVFACHSDQALALLKDKTRAEKEVLGAIPYQDNDVVLHRDVSLLPKNKRAWAAWNYLLDGEKQERAVLTYNMNILQGLPTNDTYCVTLNATSKIDESKILGQYQYAHPVFSLQTVAAQQRWAEVNGVCNTWFCGAYWGNGFHEDGVKSALSVVNALGVDWT